MIDINKILEDNLPDSMSRILDTLPDSKANIKDAMMDFGKQLLEMAAENANFNVRKYGTWHSNNFKFKTYTNRFEAIEMNNQSILDTIKYVE